jgi:hypothetical protein
MALIAASWCCSTISLLIVAVLDTHRRLASLIVFALHAITASHERAAVGPVCVSEPVVPQVLPFLGQMTGRFPMVLAHCSLCPLITVPLCLIGLESRTCYAFVLAWWVYVQVAVSQPSCTGTLQQGFKQPHHSIER